MNVKEFRNFVTLGKEPDGLDDYGRALWFDAKGEWDIAHQIVQSIPTKEAAWIHAYLHRKEGDVSNAAYWYSRANRKMPDYNLSDEWDILVNEILE